MTGKVAAFFDIDHTVLEINSGSKWISYLWKSGQMSTVMLVRSLTWLAQYRFGLLDFEAMARRVLASYKGRAIEPTLFGLTAEESERVGHGFWAQMVGPFVRNSSTKRVTSDACPTTIEGGATADDALVGEKSGESARLEGAGLERCCGTGRESGRGRRFGS